MMISDVLGFPGAMLSGSKQTPRGREGHTIYWNACVFDKDGQQIWHGDLDVTEREPDLRALAERIGTIYVTPEQPWRFDGFHATRNDPRARERLIEFFSNPPDVPKPETAAEGKASDAD